MIFEFPYVKITINMNEINIKLLEETGRKLLAKGKGIFAADESNGTADQRLEEYQIKSGSEMRRKFRNLFLAAPENEKYISGVIMYDETFWQKSFSEEKLFVELLKEKGIVPGIKVDLGAKDFPGFPEEKLTIGLDDLPERAQKYFEAGARFAKWRAVIKIDENLGLPTNETIEANADALGRYARIVQEAGLVPIVEPEILLDGHHNIETCEEVTTKVLEAVFDKMIEYRVYIPGLILKTSMVISGNQNPEENSIKEVAEATVRTLKKVVPESIIGVVFLSGGQTAVEASAHFDAIAEMEPLPWEIGFSYSRALQLPSLRIWQGEDKNVDLARAEFIKRLELNHLADIGDYDIKLEYLD